MNIIKKQGGKYDFGQEIPLFKIDEKDSSMLDMSEITIASASLAAAS